MSTVFGPSYADSYDILYRTKDYAAEVGLIERHLAKHGARGPRRILDLGCGTGGHTLPLAERGHRVTGVDRSPGMLAQARAKAARGALPADLVPAFVEADIRRLDLGERFDVALMMFMVLGYHYENSDLVSALATVRRHLHPNGFLIFDVWNGLAVLADRPRERVVEASLGTTHINRRARPRLDVIRQLCHVHYDLERTDGTETKAWEEEGKRTSRRNAVRHGLTAETVIDRLEDSEDYRGFEAARPAGAGIGRAGRLGGVARYLVPKPSERADFHGGSGGHPASTLPPRHYAGRRLIVEACVEKPDHALS